MLPYVMKGFKGFEEIQKHTFLVFIVAKIQFIITSTHRFDRIIFCTLNEKKREKILIECIVQLGHF